MLSPMAQSPRCIFCDTPRPASVPRCPECGNHWIDVTIAEAVAPPTAERPPTAPDVRAITTQPAPKRKPRRLWLFPVGITLAAVAVYAIVFAVLIDRSGPDEEPPDAASSTTVVTDPDPTTPTTAPDVSTTDTPLTTVPPTTPTTTTEPPPTTSTLPPIDPIGSAIELEDLTLGAFSLGPLTFGDGDTNALGRLAATFGQPDDRRTIGEGDGLCPTDTGTAARFGWLTAYVRDEGDAEVLVGYRLEAPPDGPDGHPTADLKTISGAAIGDTVADWNQTYRTSLVITDEVDGVSVLMLLRSSDERTLLWGPLDDSDPAKLIGIYSPRACDGGPFGSA